MDNWTGIVVLAVATAGYGVVSGLVGVTAGLVVLVVGVTWGVGLLIRSHAAERRGRIYRGVGAGLVLLSLGPTALPAQSSGGPLAPNFGLGIWTLVSFGVAFALLVRFAWPRLLAAVEARERRLSDLVAAAEEERAQAAAMRLQAARELEEARALIQRNFREEREVAERMRASILTEAQEQRAEILARARRDAERLAAAARDAPTRTA